MLQVLLWLDRFDLDGKQITARRLRSLVENNQMPLREVRRVEYSGDSNDLYNGNMLYIFPEEVEGVGAADVEFKIETDADAEKAAAYLASCFVSDFNVYGYENVLPKNAIVAAPALIHELELGCNFGIGEWDTLGETLNGSTFRCLSLKRSTVPGSLADQRRATGVASTPRLQQACARTEEPYGDTENFIVTEEGILAYCFTYGDGLPMAERRTLRFTSATITPAFFKKVVEASKNSQLACDVELCVGQLRFDVGNLSIGVPPTRSQPDDDFVTLYAIRYDIADHGNGMRLLIRFRSEDGEEWRVAVRHGKKEHEEFFETEEEEFDAESGSAGDDW
ncbi:hypothetical protein AAVH_20221 [Aphelenchoides avenae]|nr:hypothetical protein AAVH_20221 [Aphelenchus avenae]